MKFSTSFRSAICAVATGLLALATAHAQDSHFVVVSESGSKQAAAISFVSAPAAEASSLPEGQPTNLSAVPAPAEGASFYDDSHKDLGQSLAWMQEVNAAAPTYWNLYTEARIRLKMKDYAGALCKSSQAHELALKALPASQEYLTLNADVMAKAQALQKP